MKNYRSALLEHFHNVSSAIQDLLYRSLIENMLAVPVCNTFTVSIKSSGYNVLFWLLINIKKIALENKEHITD